ncbi:MAG: DUF4956 domain-containing protein [Flavobacteriales bacterium]|nr:DUF4956 domain-containing protein [Flavobacteriales bacterium]
MPPEVEGFLGMELVSDDFYKLLFRFFLNIVFLTIIIRFIYYRKTKRKDYLFTYYMISVISFMICFALKKLDIDTGMGLGLFAIFGIIRYRTNTVRIKEMTYLFISIGLSVVNALAGRQVSYAELIFINVGVTAMIYGLEYWWMVRAESTKTIVYEKIELVKPENHDKLMEDLEQRTGLIISRVQVGKIDFLRDVATIKIYFKQDEQDEYYPEDFSY